MSHMDKRLILGTQPEVDPLKEIAGQEPPSHPGRHILWNDRALKRYGLRELVLLALTAIVTIYNPIFLFVLTIAILSLVVLQQRFHKNPEALFHQSEIWSLVPESDLALQKDLDTNVLHCRCVDGHRYLAAMDLDSAGTRFLGSLSSLIRSMETNDGLFLAVTLKPEGLGSILNRGLLNKGVENHLEALSAQALDSYMVGHGGIWSVRVLAICHGSDKEVSTRIETTINGAIPEIAWTAASSTKLYNILLRNQTAFGQTKFYGSGRELAEWLVQLPSELASEVGPSIPGEFIAPIRSRPGDYDLGTIINPETLQKCARAGIGQDDLESGLLVCGGTNKERRLLLKKIIQSLLASEKRVLVISTQQTALQLASLDESGVGFELGNDFVLNPVDAEGIPRHVYIPRLLLAFQTLCNADLRGAADFELALGHAVALGNTTIADVRLNGSDDMEDAYPPSMGNASDPSSASLAGMEAVKVLHQGTAARAFYGTQTAGMKDLAQTKLSVITVPLGTSSLQKFALDILTIKLAGLQHDDALVIVLEDAEHLRTRNQPHLRRDAWSETLVRNLNERGPLVVALAHPADMSSGALGRFSSCVSFRLREAADMKVAVELLGISVVSGGMHSKARHSARETSFLRIMPDGIVLLVRNRGETCMPLQLDEDVDAPLPLSSKELARRTERMFPKKNAHARSGTDRTLLDIASGGQSELAVVILNLLHRYEPLTEEAVRKFITTSGFEGETDVQGVLARLEHSSMILRGHEIHGGVSYMNYRLTMKGSMTLRQIGQLDGG